MEEKKAFKPYIPAEKSMPELTAMAIIIGALLAVVFGAANAYLGLRVGMTVSASIPAAVISMAVIRLILKRNSILENNMVQTIGSAGESIASGCIFTLPALFMWAKEWGTETPGILEIGAIAFIGGSLGVLFMIPLRQALIVKEHGILPYPEGTACAEIQLAGEGGSQAGKIFIGLGLGAVYKFIAEGIKLFPGEIHWDIPFNKSGIGGDITPAMLGVGYICGLRVSAVLMAGGLLSWFVLIPAIATFGKDLIMFPGKVPIGEMDCWAIWSNYIRYVGAGALVMAGIISMVKAMPMIISTMKASIRSMSGSLGGGAGDRTNKDIPFHFLAIGVLALVVLAAVLPVVPVEGVGAVLLAVFGFVFAAVASRIVGVVGSSNNPASGMTIASLLIITIIFVALGHYDHAAMIEVLTIGGIICCNVTIAADASQDLKTGYIIGASPYKQQIGEIIGVVVSAASIAGILYLLDAAWGFGSAELAAPQAILMKMVVEGIMQASLPWTLVFMGAAAAIVAELLGVPSLPFAIGLYLPIHTTLPMFCGGLLRYFVDRKKYPSAAIKEEITNNGTLFASGLIAGEGIVGILLALTAVLNIDTNMSGILFLGDLGGLVVFCLLIAVFMYFTFERKKV